MQIKEIALEDLKPYEKNPRKNDDAVGPVAESIKQFGIKVPLVIDKNNVIVTGHTRYKACKKLGIEAVPCVIADDLTPQQIKAFRLADNKVAEKAEWDFELLGLELGDLGEFDMAALGFTDMDYTEGDQEEEPEAHEDDFEPAIPAEPKSQRGQVYQLGNHRLMCGDSTDAADVAKLIDGAIIDLLVTDPPYNVALGQHMRPSELKQLHRRTDGLVIDNDSWDNEEDFVEFLRKAYTNALDHMKPGAAFYIWYASMQTHNFIKAAQAAGMQIRQQLVWVKNTFALGRQDYQWRHEPCMYGWKDGGSHYFIDVRNISTVFEDAIDPDKMKKEEMAQLLKEIYSENLPSSVIREPKPSRSDLHPTMKPIKLIARSVQNSSKIGERVLDLFGGSGSTLICCEQTKRINYTMEYDPRYCDVIIERWEAMTGKRAVLISEAE